MKKFLQKTLALLALCLVSVGAWGNSVSWDISGNAYETWYSIDSNIQCKFQRNGSTYTLGNINNWQGYSYVEFQVPNKIVVSAKKEGVKISRVNVLGLGNQYLCSYQVEGVQYTSEAAYTLPEPASEIELVIKGGNCYVSGLYVEYEIPVVPKVQWTVETAPDSPSGAGVIYKDDTYYDGDNFEAPNDLTEDDVEAAPVYGYDGSVSISGNTITVSYEAYPSAPWSTNFSEVEFSKFTVVDKNSDRTTWQYYSDNGKNCIRYPYNYSNVANDYIVLTPLRLSAGKKYNIVVNVRAHSSNFAENIEVVYGTSHDVTLMTSNAINSTVVNWTTAQNINGEITIPDDGVYYFAIHCNSGANKYYLYVYSYSITEVVSTPAPAFPEEGVAYEIKNIGLDKYVNIKNHATEAGYLAADKEKLFFTWDEMKAGFTIKDEDGNYLGKSTNAWNMNSSEPDYWTVEEVSTGVYAFKSKSSNYLAPNSNTDYRLMRDKNSSFNYTFTIEAFVAPAPVAVATFDMSAAGWATLCIGKAFEVPAGYTAYVAGKLEGGVPVLVEGGEIVLTEITDVPAYTPVILESNNKGVAAPGVELFAPASAPVAPVVNYLIGNASNTAQTMNAGGMADRGFGDYDFNNDAYPYGTIGACQLYQLAKENEKVGFYRQEGGEGASIECAAHKAILAVPNAVAAASNGRLLFPGQDDITTGINAIATEKAEAIYNLQGQRVNATKAGVYVKNGKKFIVK